MFSVHYYIKWTKFAKIQNLCVKTFKLKTFKGLQTKMIKIWWQKFEVHNITIVEQICFNIYNNILLTLLLLLRKFLLIYILIFFC